VAGRVLSVRSSGEMELSKWPELHKVLPSSQAAKQPKHQAVVFVSEPIDARKLT
jgi:hypothetical protein